MAAAALRSEERIGLGVAIAAHVALVALLLWHPKSAPSVIPPERIEVTISDDVGLKSTSPEPQAEPAAAIAPELGEPPPPEPATAPPAPRVEPPRPEVRPEPPKPQAKPLPPQPAPRPVASPRPVLKPVTKPAARPEPPRPTARTAQPPPLPGMRPSAARPSVAEAFKSTTRPGAGKVGADFLKGVNTSQGNGAAQNPPAATIGPQVQASIGQAIGRQLKPHWVAPQGVDAEKLVTIVRFRLAKDGSLVGAPQVVSQSGETEANAAQKARHAEQAIRAVRLAAPFQLPEEYYAAWQTVTTRFDKRLSQ